MNFNEFLRRDGFFIIGEIGSNHNGDFNTAQRLIKVVADSGASAAKLQLFKAEDLVTSSHPLFENLKALEISPEWFSTLRDYSRELGIELIASAFNEDYFKFLESQSVLCHKLASSEAVNLGTLNAYSYSKIPILVSLGMTEWYEVESALKILMSKGKQDLSLLHCVSEYPLELEEMNLSIIRKLVCRYDFPVGFSDHSMSLQSGAWALLLGATIFEKHITLDRNQVGPDHNYALEPHEFREYVANIKKAKLSLGSGEKKYSMGELEGRFRFGTYARRDIEEGVLLHQNDVELKRPRLGIPSNLIPGLYGRPIRRRIPTGNPVNLEDLA